MSQIQVKQLISSFCKIFDYFSFSHISPEDLRLAKFNKDDVSQKMWRILFELIHYVKSKEIFLDQAQINHDFNKDSQEKTIQHIKTELIQLGYSCKDFLNLSETSFNDKDSSREVLIAIGWLFNSYELIEIFFENSNFICQQEYFKEFENQNIIDEIQKDMDKLKSAYESTNDNDLAAKLNYVKWLDGQFNYKFNSYYSSCLEKARLTHEVHCATRLEQFKPYGHLSCMEYFLLTNPEKCEKLEKILVKQNEFQQNILFWLQNEEHFWQWMESVLDEKINDNLKNKSCDSNEVPLEIKCSNYELYIDEMILKNLRDAKKHESKFVREQENMNNLEKKLKRNLNFTKESFEEYTVRNYDELKSFENELKKKFSKISKCVNLKENRANSNNNEQITSSDLKNVLLNNYDSRFVLIGKSSNNIKDSSLNQSVEQSLKKLNELLQKDCDSLKLVYEKEKNEAFKTCELLAENLKDCHIVYSNKII